MSRGRRPAGRRAVTRAGLARVRMRLRRADLGALQCRSASGSVYLSGEAPDWNARVRAGHIAASVRCRGVVNDVVVPGVSEPGPSIPTVSDESLDGSAYDVVIIGGGVIGCAAARELSRFKLRIAVLEKEEDVGAHTSSRNDGMIHPGFAPHPGTFKAWYNSKGNRMYGDLAGELGFRFRRVGSIMLFSSCWLWLLVPVMLWRAARNGVAGPVRFLTARQIRSREPNVTARQHGGVFFPSTGIVNPFEVTIALAENAVRNGVDFHFETVATGFAPGNHDATIRTVLTNRGAISARVVVNAAGCWADRVAEQAGDRFFTIHGRRGMDVVLDKRLATSQHSALAMPALLSLGQTHSKGGGLIPSMDGNLIAGPTAHETPERENYATSTTEFAEVTAQLSLNREVSADSIITYFAGVRPSTFIEDFIVERSRRVRNLVHAAGIQSPGLASAPAIAADVAQFAVAALNEADPETPVERNPEFHPGRTPRPDLSRMTPAERAKLIMARPDYGRPVCRCEDVTEGEIRDALRTPLGVCTIDGVKRRTRAGAGRCHGGFCLPRVLEIIHEETGLPLDAIRKKSGNSFLVLGMTKKMARIAHDG